MKTFPVCGPGFVALTNPTCPDEGAVGVANIEQSGNDLYVILTNGKSLGPFVLPQGEQGPKGDQGATGPAGADGTSLIWSDGADYSTATTGSLTPLKTYSTDKTNAAKNLVNVGDTIVVTSVL